MYFSRSIDTRLLAWKDRPGRSPLILRGARQVGKSAAIAHLGATFASFAVVDFELSPSFSKIFEGSLDPHKIISLLEPELGMRIIPGKTLLFFDEIQTCPRAIASLRYFKEKLPEIHVVAAGSLLEFALGKISFPVGRVEYDFVYPMSFREFLFATERGLLVEHLPHLEVPFRSIVVPASVGALLENALREYFVIGGMPAAVAAFIASKSYLEVARAHDKIILSIRDDIPKYAKGMLQIRNISRVLTEIAARTGEQITYTKLLDDEPKRNKESLFLLAKAMYVHLVRAASAHGLPLGAGADDKTFKCVFIDIGLAQRLCGRSPSQILADANLSALYKGQLAEQFVGQQLLAESSGSESESLYFWKASHRGATAEVDYLISRGGEIYPVEVKSGVSGSLKSLHLLLHSWGRDRPGICLQSRHSIATDKQVVFAPLYSVL
jgi:uncharacterized protein